mmetsp:Transcript_5689/g.5871  ORF Transcript_5689/g.5871 Transcript_5689/m.5871 type:complete len:81 (+) Transcript_5689:2594-2836(+)
MGWNEGEGLGKDSSGRVESIAESANIVAAAGRGQTKVGVGLVELPQVNYSDSNYRASLKKATLARYEQISSSQSNNNNNQ